MLTVVECVWSLKTDQLFKSCLSHMRSRWSYSSTNCDDLIIIIVNYADGHHGHHGHHDHHDYHEPPEMQKVGDMGVISLLFFLAGANFWAILGHFWAILGHF